MESSICCAEASQVNALLFSPTTWASATSKSVSPFVDTCQLIETHTMHNWMVVDDHDHKGI